VIGCAGPCGGAEDADLARFDVTVSAGTESGGRQLAVAQTAQLWVCGPCLAGPWGGALRAAVADDFAVSGDPVSAWSGCVVQCVRHGGGRAGTRGLVVRAPSAGELLRCPACYQQAMVRLAAAAGTPGAPRGALGQIRDIFRLHPAG